jgi:hypothetical protein
MSGNIEEILLSDWDRALGLALKIYEVANLRPWDRDLAMERYHNHGPTHYAVKTIARMILDEKAAR